MKVELYERIWMWAAGGLVLCFVAAILLTTTLQAIQPPSHLETIDPTTVGSSPEFGNPGVRLTSGGVTVVVLASMFSFSPNPIEVPAHVPVTFRLTSPDVIHGFEVAGTNANAMAIPGYVSQFTVTFDRPGEYVIACNEYCGIGHHIMTGKLIVR